MKMLPEISLAGLLVLVLAGTGLQLGPRVFWLATGFSVIWFVIAMVLLYRPPGVPHFDFSKGFESQDFLSRRELLAKLPLVTRIRIALCVSLSVCLIIWLGLGVIGK